MVLEQILKLPGNEQVTPAAAIVDGMETESISRENQSL
jgi:hypothetical protein